MEACSTSARMSRREGDVGEFPRKTLQCNGFCCKMTKSDIFQGSDDWFDVARGSLPAPSCFLSNGYFR